MGAWLPFVGAVVGFGLGMVVFAFLRSPEAVAANPASFTGKYLAPLLQKKKK